jgi:hypothetical protein
MLKKCAMAAALVLLLMPASAHADWLFTPNIGGSFGGDASGHEHMSWGASIGWMGAGAFGFEADLAYTPQFFESSTSDVNFIDTDNVTTWMGNILVGIPIGGQHGAGFRPYFSGGAGVMQSNVKDVNDLFPVNNNEFGVNAGAGAMGFATDHVGFRGDVRYYRQLTNPTENNNFNIDFADFNFWRGTVGLTFRW